MEETTTVEAPAHYSPNQLVTYKVIDGSNVTYNTDKVTTIEYELDGARKTLDKLKALQSKVNHIVDMLQADGWYDSSVTKEDVLNDLCETLGHNPVKTIDFSATLSVTGSLDINLAEYDENFDIVAFLADVLSVDSYNGDVVVNGFEVDDANEY